MLALRLFSSWTPALIHHFILGSKNWKLLASVGLLPTLCRSSCLDRKGTLFAWYLALWVSASRPWASSCSALFGPTWLLILDHRNLHGPLHPCIFKVLFPLNNVVLSLQYLRIFLLALLCYWKVSVLLEFWYQNDGWYPPQQISIFTQMADAANYFQAHLWRRLIGCCDLKNFKPDLIQRCECSLFTRAVLLIQVLCAVFWLQGAFYFGRIGLG